jgi:hypothetical protein
VTELLVLELAQRFWQRAGGEEPFPRELRRPLAYALPLGIVELPRLRPAALGRHLERRGLACRGLAAADRPLRAALVALAGHGFVFLDGTDPADERRFSLAHEVAHFLADYWWPRQRIERRVGPASLEVLDGRRPPTRVERIDAALGGLQLTAHVHLMERTPDGHVAGAAIDRAEQTADTLALELLAPAEQALSALGPAPADPARLLAERFGLPPAVARRYAAQLIQPEPPAAAELRRLGLADLLDPSHFVELRRNTD